MVIGSIGALGISAATIAVTSFLSGAGFTAWKVTELAVAPVTSLGAKITALDVQVANLVSVLASAKSAPVVAMTSIMALKAILACLGIMVGIFLIYRLLKYIIREFSSDKSGGVYQESVISYL